MNERRLCTVAQLRDFLDGTEEVRFEALGTQERYAYVVATFEALDRLAAASSDSIAAQALNEARTRLFRSIHRRSKPAA